MFNALANLFFPKVCLACNDSLNDNEYEICTSCRHDLPVTNYHFDDVDIVSKVLYGRVQVENATALLRFEKKGIVQQLIHKLKYKDQESIGAFLGDWLGGELSEVEVYKSIDIVIPVPLHEKKLKKRGYNQVAKFGQQIAEALGAEYRDDILLKVSNTESQVLKKRLMRWNDNDSLFTLNNNVDIANKHILLVDDLITTGATMEACISVLNQVKSAKISIATMAIAS
jgi:ComF family protein